MSELPFATLPEALKAQGKSTKFLTYIDGEQQETRVTYAELYQRALGVLRFLQERHVTPGSELIILTNNNSQFIDVFWACLLGGITPVPLALGHHDSHRLKVLKVFSKLKKPFLFTQQKNLTRLRSFAQASGLTAEFSALEQKTLFGEQITDLSRPGAEHPCSADDVAFIQFSSGSTGEPKGVVLTHRNLLTNIFDMVATARLGEETTFSWMPLTHDMGIIGYHLTPIAAGFNQYIMPTELFVKRPLLWLKKAGEKKATLLASPNFGYEYVLKHFNPEKLTGLDLSSVRLIFNGAEPISAEISRRFIAAFKPYHLAETAIFPVYGLAEASLAVSFPEPRAPLTTSFIQPASLRIGEKITPVEAASTRAIELVAVGQPLKYCEVRIVDHSQQVLPEQSFGHIQIRGDNVTQHYYADETLNQTLFTEDGWLATGDLGFFYQNQLYITGRAKDLIILNGQNYAPQDIEEALAKSNIAELGRAAACGVTQMQTGVEELVLFLVHRGELAEFIPLANAARNQISLQFGLDFKIVIPVERIPKTTSGKLQRFSLVEDYHNGRYQTVLAELDQLKAQQPEDDSTQENALIQELCAICNKYLEKPIYPQDNIFDSGTSSLTLAQIYEEINERYPNRIEITDIFDHPTIAELAVYLNQQEEKVN